MQNYFRFRHKFQLSFLGFPTLVDQTIPSISQKKGAVVIADALKQLCIIYPITAVIMQGMYHFDLSPKNCFILLQRTTIVDIISVTSAASAIYPLVAAIYRNSL